MYNLLNLELRMGVVEQLATSHLTEKTPEELCQLQLEDSPIGLLLRAVENGEEKEQRRELLAVVTFMQPFRPYLLGRQFLHTDRSWLPDMAVEF